MKAPLLKRLSWPNTIYLILCPIVTFVLLPIYLSREGFQWSFWLLFVVSCFFTNLSITAGYHRLFAHKSYEANRWLRIFYLLIGASAFQGSALKWATDHRRHHRHVDTPDDPYNIHEGFFYAHMGWLFLEDNPEYKGKYPHDLVGDRDVYWQDKFYLPLVLIIGLAVPTFVGYLAGSALGGFVLLAGLRLIVTNHATFFINSLCHFVGKQPYTDQNSARDSFIMAILACGEGYHNFHHRFQSDYRNGVRWYHWDPTKWWVSLWAFLGQARSLKRTPSYLILKARLEMDARRLVRIGVPEERLLVFRHKIDQAQERWRQLKLDYAEMKQNMRDRSNERLKQMKVEIRLAKKEFKNTLADWYVVRKHPRLLLAYSHV